MTTQTRSDDITRDRILKLLSDPELAKVSTAETATRLPEGEQYIDLEELGQGVQRASGKGVAMGRVLPKNAVLGTVSYLSVRQSEQSNVAPWVPFIIAFGVIALVISVLIVVNVVGGAVVAGTTRIGVLKSVGFTPAQVMAAYVLLVAGPALAGTVAGAVAGNLLAIPLLEANARS